VVPPVVVFIFMDVERPETPLTPFLFSPPFPSSFFEDGDDAIACLSSLIALREAREDSVDERTYVNMMV
jgi:hypothetical protein